MPKKKRLSFDSHDLAERFQKYLRGEPQSGGQRPLAAVFDDWIATIPALVIFPDEWERQRYLAAYVLSVAALLSGWGLWHDLTDRAVVPTLPFAQLHDGILFPRMLDPGIWASSWDPDTGHPTRDMKKIRAEG